MFEILRQSFRLWCRLVDRTLTTNAKRVGYNFFRSISLHLPYEGEAVGRGILLCSMSKGNW